MSVRMRRDRHHVAARCSIGIICVGAATAAARCARRRSPHGLVRVEAHALSSRRRRRRHCVVAPSWTQLRCCLRHCNRVVARARTASLGVEPTPVASEIARGRQTRHYCAISACAAAIHHHAIPARLLSIQSLKSSASVRASRSMSFLPSRFNQVSNEEDASTRLHVRTHS